MVTDRLLTPRLLLRRWERADDAQMDRINSDPEVLRYLNRAAPPGLVQRFREHWDEHGFGPWAVTSRERPGELLGFVGPAYPGFLPEVAHRPELGWRLGRSAWGRGVATEAALAASDHAFVATRLREVVAIIHPDNERSRRVANKLGMAIERHVHNPLLGIDVDLWARTP